MMAEEMRQTLTFTARDWNSLTAEFRSDLMLNYDIMLPAGEFLKGITPTHPFLVGFEPAPRYTDYIKT